MGKNSKARRDAKAKARGRSGGDPRGGGFGAGRRGGWAPREDQFFDPMRAREILMATAEARGGSYGSRGLRDLAQMPAEMVGAEAELLMLDVIGGIWAGGWQPAELHRQARIGCSSAVAARLFQLAMAVDHVRRRSVTLDVRWTEQVESLDLPATDGRAGWIRRWADAEGLDWPDALGHIVDVLANHTSLPRLDPILPPPGSAGGRPGSTGEHSGPEGAQADPVLERIRNLLAKAESTTFEAEASALTAKAHELMTRHAIDAAQLHDRRHRDERPVTIRVPIDAPYADAKSLLLQTVAAEGRCRSIFHTGLALSTVVGFADDISAVEMLFTSLLVQAQSALADAAKRAPAGTRTRSQSYRSAFLLSFTQRIAQRLREINEAVFAEVEAEQGPSFLPVLRSRSDAIDELMAKRFGDLTSSPVRSGYDPAGWAGGRVAADNAQLVSGHIGTEV